jgi:hypothetical protein
MVNEMDAPFVSIIPYFYFAASVVPGLNFIPNSGFKFILNNLTHIRSHDDNRVLKSAKRPLLSVKRPSSKT